MFCPSDVNTGFIELVGPILQNDLNSITVNSYPLSISFAPRTTPPTLIGNRLDESTENTCTYKGKRFSLVDVQICSVTNKGYILPGITNQPVAELILSFSANNSASDLSTLSGILMCIPIYDSGNESYSDYLNQIIDPNVPTCKYTSESGTLYNGMATLQLNDQTLSSCISAACNNPKILAYTYSNGTCWLFDNIPPINKVKDTSIISGTVNHNVSNLTCDNTKKSKPTNGDNTSKLAKNLESIFYSKNDTTVQSSIAYKTCFETIDSNNVPNSKSLYVVVFPNGIHLTQSGFQQLLTQLNNNLPPYMIPPAIRGGDATLRSYKFDDEGEKVPTITSTDGIIYSTPISSCTDDFKHRFEYFTAPPRLPNSSKYNSEQCPYYKTTQYKCVPFNQLTDLSGQYVIPGNKTLDTILYEQQQTQEKENKLNVSSEGLTTEQVEGIVAGVAGIAIVGALCLWAGSKISKYA